MDGVTIRTEGEQAVLPLAVLPLIICGVWGYLLLFQSLDGVVFDPVPVFFLAAAVPSLLWAGQRAGGRWFVPTLLAGLAGLCVWGAQGWADGPGAQAGALLGYWFGDRIPVLEIWFGTAPPDHVTELAAVLAAVLSLSLFASECLFRDHEVPYTIATALLVYLPLLGLRADTAMVFLLALFRLAPRAAHNAAAQAGRSLLPAPQRTRLAAQSAAALCVLLSLSFLAADILSRGREEALYEPVYRIEKLIVREIREAGERIRGRERSGSGLDGKIGGGNQYQFDTPQLELYASLRPEEPLYLRAFVGGAYDSGAWSDAVADDAAIFQTVQPEMMPEDPESWAGSAERWFNGMYFELNQEQSSKVFSRLLSSQAPSDTDRLPGLMPVSSRSLILRNLSRSDSGTYTPYYSYPMPSYAGASVRNALELFQDTAYGFLYYQQDQMRIDWNFLLEVSHGMASWYGTFQDAYLREAREVYTRVPAEQVPRLAELVRENPLSDTEEITTFILHTLHSRASYTLTPGRPPGNRDVVEHFLFETGKGYCQHFAAAAALMYRLYGIPARYAAGYAALPSAFQPVYEDGASEGVLGGGASDTLGDTASGTPDGTADGTADGTVGGTASDGASENDGEERRPSGWYAKVTDRSAHAWVEIFLDGYGWTPVEVTPPAAESAAGTEAAANYPGFDQEVRDEIAEEHGWTSPRSGEDGEPGTDSPDGDNSEHGGTSGNPGGIGDGGGFDNQEDGGTGGSGGGNKPSTLRRDGGFVNYLVFFLFTALLLTPPAFIGRRKRILARMDAMDCREALYRMGDLLRFAGTPVDEAAEDYPARLADAVPVMTTDEAERFAAAASRAAFGQRPPEEAENVFARALYRRAAEWVYSTLNRRRKLAFQWWNVLG